MKKKKSKILNKNFLPTKPIFVGVFLISSFFLSYISLPQLMTTQYKNQVANKTIKLKAKSFVATHVKTPKAVKAIYMTACVASTPKLRKKLVQLVEDTEINTIVLNIKDETGKIAFDVDNPELKGSVAKISKGECKISNIKSLIAGWHKKGIYVIGRIPVFQDLYLTHKRPDLAVKKESDKSVWEDRKGIRWLDAGSKYVWNYIVAIGMQSYNDGFDELNFDYVRFPSDGNMENIYYPFSEKKVLADPDFGKAKVLRDFFAYLKKSFSKTKVVLSADLFGMTTTNKDDLNIGQVLEYAAPYFNYIDPMVYPSHYPPHFNGWLNPNKHPYGIVKFSLDHAVKRLITASTSPLKLRPWLQDFNYGGHYGIPEVKAQIQATYDAGLTSWMLWDAANRYTRGALKNK